VGVAYSMSFLVDDEKDDEGKEEETPLAEPLEVQVRGHDGVTAWLPSGPVAGVAATRTDLPLFNLGCDLAYSLARPRAGVQRE
jgi:hypothetical protein